MVNIANMRLATIHKAVQQPAGGQIARPALSLTSGTYINRTPKTPDSVIRAVREIAAFSRRANQCI